jgi:hypothetical protein
MEKRWVIAWIIGQKVPRNRSYRPPLLEFPYAEKVKPRVLTPEWDPNPWEHAEEKSKGANYY